MTGAFPAAFVLAVAPLAIAAAFGLQRRPVATQERILWLWPAAAVVVYAVDLPGAGRGLVGLAIPLAVLAARGWRRLPAVVAAVAVAVLVVPGMVKVTRDLRRIYNRPEAGYELTGGEAAALADLAHEPGTGGVVAPLPLGSVVPAITGRPVWAGHASWTPGFSSRAETLQRLYSGSYTDADGQRTLAATDARFAIATCQTSPRFSDYIPQGASIVSRHGCVRVYRL